MTERKEKEIAIVSWLNALGLQEKEIAHLAEMKDGVLLLKILNQIDAKEFPVEGFNFQADHWSLCVSNLQKLNQYMERYLNHWIKVPVMEKSVDFQAIARTDDSLEMVGLCEKVIGVVGNCPKKDQYIDAILRLDERVQAILMEIMVQYLLEPPEPTQPVEAPGIDQNKIEELHHLLKEQEAEKILIKDQHERQCADLRSTIEKLQTNNKELLKSRDNLKNEILENQKKLNIFKINEEELKEEITNLKEKIKITNEQHTKICKVQDEKITEMGENLFIAEQKVKKLAATETLLEQQKAKTEQLIMREEQLVQDLKKKESFESKITELQISKKELEEKNKKLIEELYSQKSLRLESEGEYKKISLDCSRMEKEARKFEEKMKYWENKALSLDSSLIALRSEYDAIKISEGAGSLFKEERENQYIEEINKLKAQVELLSSASGETIKAYVIELEAKMTNINIEKDKQYQELLLCKKSREDLENVNEELSTQIEIFRKMDESSVVQAQEYQKMKTTLDMLQNDYQRLQLRLEEITQLNAEIGVLNTKLSQQIEIAEFNKKALAQSEYQLKLEKEASLELEKQLARFEEKNGILQEESKRLEQSLKDYIKKTEIETSERIQMEVQKGKEKIKKRYQTQFETLKSTTEFSEESVSSKIKEQSELCEKYEIRIKNLEEKHQEEVATLKHTIKEITENNKREERLLSSAFYELGMAINNMNKDKAKPNPTIHQKSGKLDSAFFQFSQTDLHRAHQK